MIIPRTEWVHPTEAGTERTTMAAEPASPRDASRHTGPSPPAPGAAASALRTAWPLRRGGAGTAQPYEPRAQPLFRPGRAMECRLRMITAGDFLPARVLDISRCGLGMSVGQPLPPGGCALIEL